MFITACFLLISNFLSADLFVQMRKEISYTQDVQISRGKIGSNL